MDFSICFLLLFSIFQAKLNVTKGIPMKQKQRKLFDREDPHVLEDEEYLKYILPENQHLDEIKNNSARLGFIQMNKKWVTKLLMKID